jgi:hemerythrin-like domain-containing protein
MTRVPLPGPGALPRGPEAGFDAPFEMLAACHERVERMLALLERLDRHLAARGADRDAADAARDVMRYFDLAGPAHHEDEERHVLPRLRALGHAAAADRLHEDHQRMAAAWAGVRAGLEAVREAAPAVAGPSAPDPRPPTASGDWAGFARLYRDHIAVEEGAAYPVVASAVDPAALDAMGREMAARRGLRPD